MHTRRFGELTSDEVDRLTADTYIYRSPGCSHYSDELCNGCLVDLLDPLPKFMGLPSIDDVTRDNPHGTNWKLRSSGDQGREAADINRYWARFESDEGYWADYFAWAGQWSLGAN